MPPGMYFYIIWWALKFSMAQLLLRMKGTSDCKEKKTKKKVMRYPYCVCFHKPVLDKTFCSANKKGCPGL
jgi:hypothetical protein